MAIKSKSLLEVVEAALVVAETLKSFFESNNIDPAILPEELWQSCLQTMLQTTILPTETLLNRIDLCGTLQLHFK